MKLYPIILTLFIITAVIAVVMFAFELKAIDTSGSSVKIIPIYRTDGTVNFQVLTVTNHGQYSPRNIGAIWITTESGTFIKTLQRWGSSEYIDHLTKWHSFTATGNTTGAITGATLNTHSLHNLNWNCRNTSNVEVADGNYKVWVEFTESTSSGPWTSVTFTKGASAQHLTPANQAYFQNMLLDFTPTIVVGAPTNLQATVTATNTVNLTWSAPASTSGLTAYKVYRDATLITTITNVSTTAYTDSPALGSHTYYVTAMFGTTESAHSNSATVNVNPIVGAPVNLQATVTATNTVNLTWSAPASTAGLTAYKVYRDTALITTITNVSTTAYTDSPALGSHTYYVTAMFGTTESAHSNNATVNVNPIVGAPVNLQATVTATNTVNLTWSAPASTAGLTAYKVYRDTALITTITNVSTTAYTDSPALGSHTYYVTAMFGTTESAHSNNATVNVNPIVGAPVNLQATVTATNTVNLTWSAPASTAGLTAYKVYRDDSVVTTITNVSTTAYTDSPALGSHTYYVTAMFGTTESAHSNNATVNINPITGPPVNLQVSVFNSNIVNLSWSAPASTSGLTAYKIYRDSALLATTANATTINYTDTATLGQHSYYVTALYGATESIPSNVVTVNIVAAIDGPTGLQATVISSNNVNLTWTAPTSTSGMTAYKVYRDGTMIMMIMPATTTSCVDTPSNGDHTYFVTAMFGITESMQSNIVNVNISAVIGSPTNLQAVVNMPNVNLSWSAPASTSGMTAYKIYRDGTMIMMIMPAITTSYTDIPTPGEHSYYITSMFGVTESIASNTVTITITANHDATQLPGVTVLNGNYPNPFNPETSISFSLANTEYANLTIYNSSGKHVKNLLQGTMPAGLHEVTWNGIDDNGNKVASGLYFYKLETQGKSLVRKMIMLK